MSTPTKTILIADDETDIRSIIKTKLEAAGFAVTEASNGKEALESMRESRPDLVVMDVKMPVMNGVEAVGAMKGDDELKDILVVFLTNYGEDDIDNAWIDEKYAKEIGALGHIRKTDDLSVIVERIQGLLNG
jgi:CheY-like chemotaxis protein